MKPLILTGRWMPDFTMNGLADLALDLALFDFVEGPQPSPDELAAYLGPRTASLDQVPHWSDWGGRQWKQSANRKHRDLSLAEFCQQYDAVELWFDMRPSAQLQLIWLLDYFRSCPETVDRLKLRLVDLEMIGLEKLGRWDPPAVDVTEKELATASAAWQAWRSPTPVACFDLLRTDLTALPLLEGVLVDLLEELPSASTGLGASEMRMLQMIARGYSRTSSLFYFRELRHTDVFGEFALGNLLEGLAHAPMPAATGLDDILRTTRRDNYKARDEAYKRSRLSLTEFGKAIVAHEEDFSRHNPIDRWWGGTHLTNDNLWRWNPALIKPSRRPSERSVP
ncbi:hypothetical protein J6524_29315 [Bradyrhizobium sp. WSM 1738]|uniref:hypothetical protein n=1 Tax=Bradyrhizobium hereditatis TaxID=2821405 RepID=UPI001CE2D76C|nr:hypothetical protein [Bradyrhizobium hereditatis]MCA6118948.1 hypothetical protein [Bradyrhizobium hereditatis]